MVRSDRDEISAMPGLAIDNSVNGVSLSTTTARFIGTFNALDGAPRITCSVSACEIVGAEMMAKAKLAATALIKFLHVIVTCLSDRASFYGSFYARIFLTVSRNDIYCKIQYVVGQS